MTRTIESTSSRAPGTPRRDFLAASAAGAAAAALGVERALAARHPAATDDTPGAPVTPAAASLAQPARPGDAHRGPCAIASGNGLAAAARAMELMAAGTYVLDAIVAGVRIIEDDPSDNSVGYGGLPNEDGVVELDASVMDGRLHRAGSVASLRNIRNPAAVALLVMRRTNHVMLVGEGALRFARAMGFPEENLLTEESRQAWLRWRQNRGKDDWLDDAERDPLPPGASDRPPAPGAPPAGGGGAGGGPGAIPFTTGTVHCSGLSAAGDLAAVTSTSGLSWKIPGRIGDSPICGAGMYCDNAVGSAGATGRGEAVIQVCGSFSVVQHMEAGLAPTDACLAVLKRIADRTREKRLRDASGRPNFNVSLYALRKDGAYGGACLLPGGTFAVHDGTAGKVHPCVPLYDKPPASAP
jgi:N4-(beta-N-acetylglucosaminyl)-L-asparaginase